jgi:hypothetical protein
VKNYAVDDRGEPEDSCVRACVASRFSATDLCRDPSVVGLIIISKIRCTPRGVDCRDGRGNGGKRYITVAATPLPAGHSLLL